MDAATCGVAAGGGGADTVAPPSAGVTIGRSRPPGFSRMGVDVGEAAWLAVAAGVAVSVGTGEASVGEGLGVTAGGSVGVGETPGVADEVTGVVVLRTLC